MRHSKPSHQAAYVLHAWQFSLFIVLGTSVICPFVCQAHKELVHQSIAESAVKSSDGFTRFVNETMGGQNTTVLFYPDEFSETKPQTPLYWVRQGAYYEDHPPRYGNHFYTVKTDRVVGEARGLTDGSETADILPVNTTNSYAWASVKGLERPHWPWPSGNWNEENVWNWDSARTYQYQGLTMTSKEDRGEKMARMFYALGHVIHLNQDTSQPDHVRDDEHIPGQDHIEWFGKNKVLKQQPGLFALRERGWAYWRQAGFKKLRDFWDRGFYRGNAWALDLDASGNPNYQLGLAEFSNGNLLGENALYAEFFDENDIHYFPHPSLVYTDQPQLKAGSWGSHLDVTTLENAKQGQRIYLRKARAGVTVEKHSAVKYLAAQNLGKMGILPARAAVTIHDDSVLQAYHEVMIPKAIEYSAGILDYFFRGRIDVCPTYSGAPGQYNLAIKNKSGEAFKDGAFRLFYDNAEGFRTEIVAPDFAISYSGSLADNEVITGTFTAPTEPVTAYILVFKGTIGTTDDAASDSVDKDIAVAAKRFTWIGGPGESVPPEATAWVAALTKSVPSVSAVYSRQVCNTTGLLCENLDELLATFSIYNLVPSQSNLSLTPASTYSGPTFWLSISWGNGAINTALEIQNGFSSQLVYSVSASIGEAQGFAESCEDCVIAPPDPPVGDYPLTLQISPCDPSF